MLEYSENIASLPIINAFTLIISFIVLIYLALSFFNKNPSLDYFAYVLTISAGLFSTIWFLAAANSSENNGNMGNLAYMYAFILGLLSGVTTLLSTTRFVYFFKNKRFYIYKSHFNYILIGFQFFLALIVVVSFFFAIIH